MITTLMAAMNGFGSSISKTTDLLKASTTSSELQTGDFLVLSDKVSSNAAIQRKAAFVFDMVSKVYELI